MMFPESLILYGNERVDKVFRHVFIFDNLTILSIEDVVYLFSLVIVYYRGCINMRIDILVVVLRSKSYNGKDNQETCQNTNYSKISNVKDKLSKTENIWLVLYFFTVFYVNITLRRVVVLVFLKEKGAY